jgi:hypothetical protein
LLHWPGTFQAQFISQAIELIFPGSNMFKARPPAIRFPICLLVLGAQPLFAQTTPAGSGQAYPSRPVRIITSEAGGGTDFAARLVAHGISGPLGQPVIIDTRGSGI